MGGLFDMDKGLKEFTLKTARESERLNIGIKRIHPKTMQKMTDTVDQALLNLKPSSSQALTWTMCGALLGYNSKEPTASTNHLWEKAFEAFQYHVKSSNIFIGSLLRWRITSLANSSKDNWFTAKSETDGVDIDTGEPITRATYWINNDFKMKKKPIIIKNKAATQNQLNQLAAKFKRN